jgi:hypothetical protein
MIAGSLLFALLKKNVFFFRGCCFFAPARTSGSESTGLEAGKLYLSFSLCVSFAPARYR